MLVDRSMAVRCAAAEVCSTYNTEILCILVIVLRKYFFSFQCTKELIKHASFTYTTELETLFSVCLKALEGSNYDVRVGVSSLLGKLMAASQRPPDGSTPPANSKVKKISIDEMFDLMSSGFLRGGIGFLKSGGGELLKTTMPQEVRVGVTQVMSLDSHLQNYKFLFKFVLTMSFLQGAVNRKLIMSCLNK